MTDGQVLEIVGDAFFVALQVAGPILGAALLIGVAVSILQTITQVQEMTLSFVPKLVGAALIVLVGGNWMIRIVTGWVTGLWATIPGL